MENKRPNFIYLDTETTGLGPEDQVTEVAWLSNNGLSHEQYFVPHDRLPNRWVIEQTDYVERIFPGEKTSAREVADSLIAYCHAIKLRSESDVVYLVGACPAFDDRMLRRSVFEPLGLEPPWSHRLVDIEIAVATFFGYETPISLSETRLLLGLEGANFAPHNAFHDAEEVRALHTALYDLQVQRSAQWKTN